MSTPVTDNNELVGLRVEIGRLVKRIRPDALHAFGDGDVRNTGAVKRLGSDFLDAVGQLDCPQAAAVDKRTAGDRPYAVGQRDRTERIAFEKAFSPISVTGAPPSMPGTTTSPSVPV